MLGSNYHLCNYVFSHGILSVHNCLERRNMLQLLCRASQQRRNIHYMCIYGGVLSGGAIRERIIRAFLVEEQKIVKKVLKIQKLKEKVTKS